MTSNMRWKVILVLLVLVLAVWRSSYTFRFLSLNETEKEQMTAEQLEDLKASSLSLGLDLQGGMHIVLDVDKEGLPADEAADAMERAVEVITNRIDQFGVAEPSIQIEGENRIIVQLPGLKDEQRAKRLIGRTALLEFIAVAPPAETDIVLRSIDRALVDTLVARGEVPLESETGLPLTEMEQLEKEHPFSIHVRYLHQLPFFLEEEVAWAKEKLDRIDLDSVLPGHPSDPSRPRYRIAWGQEARQFGTEEKYRPFYVLERDAVLTGSSIVSADVRPGLDQDNPNAPGVSMRLSRAGGRTFAKHTGAHIGEYLAVVLDGFVYKAPVIKSRIPAGTPTSITGGFTDEEAKDLAIVLRAGKLPAPMTIVEERTVGPSLGKDSIRLGLRAMVVGFLLVIIFMLVYYKASGAIAVGALAANIVIVIGIMATLPVNPRPALTLPGLAGLILTIGMAVDANVLIFERIREELRNGKTIRAGIRDGYERAFTTIMDANVTTLIAAAVLLRFGSGPVKGFGVTLSLGILASMFTAIVATRVVFDLITVKWNVKNLSI
jgi:protein-export membrane protein SecD